MTNVRTGAVIKKSRLPHVAGEPVARCLRQSRAGRLEESARMLKAEKGVCRTRNSRAQAALLSCVARGTTRS